MFVTVYPLESSFIFKFCLNVTYPSGKEPTGSFFKDDYCSAQLPTCVTQRASCDPKQSLNIISSQIGPSRC